MQKAFFDLRWIFFLFLLTAFFSWQVLAQGDSLDVSSQVAMVAPLSGDVVQDSAIVIVKPDNPADVTSAGISLQTPDGVTVVSEQISSESSWIGSLDTTQVPDGMYEVKVEACSGITCSHQQVEVQVDNVPGPESPPAIEPPLPPVEVPSGETPPVESVPPADVPPWEVPAEEIPPLESVPPSDIPPSGVPPIGVPPGDVPPVIVPPSDVPSWETPETGMVVLAPPNWASALYIQNPQSFETLFVSSGDALTIPVGTYFSRVVFFDPLLKEMSFSNLNVDTNGSLVFLDENVIPSSFFIPFEGEEFFPSRSVHVQSFFQSDKMSVLLQQWPGFGLFFCSAWEPLQKQCVESWQKVDSFDNPVSLDFSSSSFVFVWTRLKISGDEEPLGAIPPLPDDNVLFPFPSPPPAPVETILVTPSTIPALLTLFDEHGVQVASSSVPFEIPKGTYNAELRFFYSSLSSLFLSKVNLDSNGILVDVDENIDFSFIPEPRELKWFDMKALVSHFSFSSGSVVFQFRQKPDSFFRCEEWDFAGKNCTGSFGRIVPLKNEGTPSGVKTLPLETPILPSDENILSSENEKVLPSTPIPLSDSLPLTPDANFQAVEGEESPVSDVSPILDMNTDSALPSDIFPTNPSLASPAEMLLNPNEVRFSLLPSSQAFGFVFSPKKLRLIQSVAGFSANDLPRVNALLSLDNGAPTDFPLDASLTFPDGSVHSLDVNQIKREQLGSFEVKAFRPRSFQPGLYTITVKEQGDSLAAASPTNNTLGKENSSVAYFQSPPSSSAEESVSFYWGLIALNSHKSIYKPGETVEFEIVVLDKDSFGVSGASVSLAVLSPVSGQTTILSTAQGTVLETTTPGIYVARLLVQEEGTYEIEASAFAGGIDTSIQTTFDVHSNYAFDILRWTATKMDPARQPIDVALTISPFQSDAQQVTVREFVPKDFNLLIGSYAEQFDSQGESYSVFVPDPNVSITENENEKIIEWKNISFVNQKEAVLKYQYIVPDKKPWLYLLGPIDIIVPRPTVSSSDSALDSNVNVESISSDLADPIVFSEARSWMVAVDANPTSLLYFRAGVDFNGIREPSPNDANCGVGCGISSYTAGVQTFRGISDITNTADINDTLTGAGGDRIVKMLSFVSPPLVPQTITTSGTWTAGMVCKLSAGSNTSRPLFGIYQWLASTDSNGLRITNFISASAACSTSSTRVRQGTGSGIVSSVTFNRGDKIIVEADINVPAATTVDRTMTYLYGSSAADSNVTLPSGVSLRFAGDANTQIVSPANGSSKVANVAFDVNAQGICFQASATTNSGFSCGDVNMSLQYCVLTGGVCGAFSDMNTVATSPLYISSGTALQSDDLMDASDLNYFIFTVSGTQANTYTIRSKIDGNWTVDTNYSNKTNGDINVTIIAQNYSFVLSLPSSGCTTGKGNITGGSACQRAWIETTDLTGVADENQIQPEGQSTASSTPFFFFDNQSSTSSDLNILLDLNASFPSSLVLKASTSTSGYQGQCTGVPSGCKVLATTASSIGKATYTAATQDLNVYFWGDFISAGGGETDRNVDSNSVSPT